MKKRKRKKKKGGVLKYSFLGIIYSTTLLVFVIALLSLYFSDEENTAKIEINDSFDIHGDVSTTPESTLATPLNLEGLPSFVSLNVKFVSQYPELPSGCEVTSLTEVLNYLGYKVDKEDLAQNYLNYDSEIKEGCFMNYFLGSPYNTNAFGCFAPALTETANKYLKTQNSFLQAYNISSSSVEELLSEVVNGNPVIVWTTLHYNIKDVKYQPIQIDAQNTFDWPLYEHCVVLIGYDLSNSTVTFADPTYGIVSRSIDDFSYFYGKYYEQAMVIKN